MIASEDEFVKAFEKCAGGCDDKYAAHDPKSEHFCRNCGAKLMD